MKETRKMVKEFIKNVKLDADQAQYMTEQELKRKEALNNNIMNLMNEIEFIKIRQERINVKLGYLYNYKVFIDLLWAKFGANSQLNKKKI